MSHRYCLDYIRKRNKDCSKLPSTYSQRYLLEAMDVKNGMWLLKCNVVLSIVTGEIGSNISQLNKNLSWNLESLYSLFFSQWKFSWPHFLVWLLFLRCLSSRTMAKSVTFNYKTQRKPPNFKEYICPTQRHCGSTWGVMWD